MRLQLALNVEDLDEVVAFYSAMFDADRPRPCDIAPWRFPAPSSGCWSSACVCSYADRMEIWHNPSCSKSRSALRVLEAGGARLTVRRYLDDPPDHEALARVVALLGREP